MTVKELLDDLEGIPWDTPVYVSVEGKEVPATQMIWQGSSPTRIIIDDYPLSEKTPTSRL